MEKVIPLLLIIFNILASAGYVTFKDDYARMLYYLSAAAITFSVTFADGINLVFRK